MCGCRCTLTASGHTHETLIALALAGPSTPTYNEILSVVAGGSAAFGAGGLADINTQVAALCAALSRQSAGNNTLTIADAVWTRGIAVNPAQSQPPAQLLMLCAVCVQLKHAVC